MADRERISRAERTLRRALHASQTPQSQEHGPESPARERASVALAVPAHKPEFDYAGFEERFRGSEEEIKERQRIYVPYFEGRNDVLDIGCGRGEFLELMRESGIQARGVDLDLDMILLCRDKGLDVSVDDAFAYLGALPDDSLGGIFAAQVIEHLHPLSGHRARQPLPPEARAGRRAHPRDAESQVPHGVRRHLLQGPVPRPAGSPGHHAIPLRGAELSPGRAQVPRTRRPLHEDPARCRRPARTSSTSTRASIDSTRCSSAFRTMR